MKQFGWERLSEGGLKVYTTIDPDDAARGRGERAKSLEQIEMRRAREAEDCTRPASRSKPRLSRWIRRPAKCARWLAAATSRRAGSIARRRRCVSRARRSSRSSTPSALEAGYSPASLVTRLDEPIQTLQGAWMPEDEHSDGAAMTVRTALRTSSNRAAVRMLEEVGIAKDRRAGTQDGHRQRAERAVTRARLGRSHADGDDVGVCRVRRPGAAAARPRSFAASKTPTERCCSRRSPLPKQVLSPRTAFLMTSMLSDVVNYGTAYKARQEGFTLPGSGKDRHDERLRRRVVRRLHAAPRDRCLGRIRQAAHDHRERVRRRARRADVGALHESGDGERQARHVQDAGRID